MAQKTAQHILKENLERCRTHESKKRQSLRAVGKASTVGRVARGGTNPSLKTLENIATKFGLQVWQLLYPGLDPGNKPVALSEHEKAVYENMRKSAKELVEQDARTVQSAADKVRSPQLIGRYSKATLFDDDMGDPET